MRELAVEMILARSPQAKGRVERSNGVLQDRLVKELALAGVAGIDAANAWLASSGYWEKLDDRFAVEPAEDADAHRRQLASTNLLENLMRRLKKRTAVVCVFPNRASCDRLTGAQLLEVHEQWQAEPRAYLSMTQAPAAAPAAAAAVAESRASASAEAARVIV